MGFRSARLIHFIQRPLPVTPDWSYPAYPQISGGLVVLLESSANISTRYTACSLPSLIKALIVRDLVGSLVMDIVSRSIRNSSTSVSSQPISSELSSLSQPEPQVTPLCGRR